MFGVFLRSKFRKLSAIVVPIGVIPLVHLVFTGILKMLNEPAVFGISPLLVLAFGDMIALCITCGIIVALSTKILSKKIKRLYLIGMLIYSLIIGWSYIYYCLDLYFALQ